MYKILLSYCFLYTVYSIYVIHFIQWYTKYPEARMNNIVVRKPQGSGATVYRWGGQVYSSVVSNFLRISCTKIIEIGRFMTELFLKSRCFWDTVYITRTCEVSTGFGTNAVWSRTSAGPHTRPFGMLPRWKHGSMRSRSFGIRDSLTGEWPSGGPCFNLPWSPPSINLALKIYQHCSIREEEEDEQEEQEETEREQG